ncbi:MAG TPA: TonB-dependent receptor, partial [Steroidobacteraceae bacterium]|nr:TonB-dependent receptor [Steroidobacteraceae bacterium]
SSITAYNQSENTNGYDVSARLVPLDTPTLDIFNSQVEDISQEFRVLSPRDRDFRWLAGVYYYNEEAGDGFDAGGTFDPSGTDPERAGLKRLYDSGDSVENMAVFAMLEYDLTDRFTMTFEGRWQEDKITSTDEVIDDSLAGTGIRAPYENEQEATFTEFLPRITARYALSNDMNLYGSVAKGNKPGGFNDLPPESNFFDPDVYQEFVAQYNTFDEESVISYELGLKGQSNRGRFGYNVAAYYLDWQDQQLTQSQPYQLAPTGTTGTTVPLIVNAGESEIKGIELELNGAPTDWLSYRLGYAWADAEFTDFYDENTEELLDTDGLPSSDPNDVDGPNGQVAGNKIPQTPEHMANASATLTFPIGTSAIDWFVRADYGYESKRYVQVHNLAWAGDSHLLNLRAGLTGDRWSVTVFYDNALDDDTPLVVTRLLDFTRPLLIPDPVRNFVFLQNRRLTFFRDFTIAAPRKPAFGMSVSYQF